MRIFLKYLNLIGLLLISGAEAQYYNLGAMWQGPKLVFTMSPSATAVANIDFNDQPEIGIVSAKGILITGATDTVTLSVASDSRCRIPAPGSVGVSANPLSASAGLVSFSGVSYSQAGTVYLKAEAPGKRPACSSAIVVSGAVSFPMAFKQIRTIPDGSWPNGFSEHEGRLHFRAVGGSEGDTYWTSDGTTANTQALKTILPFDGDPVYMVAAGGLTYFSVYSVIRNRSELWRTDWTSAGTFNLGVEAPYKYVTFLGTIVWVSSTDYVNFDLSRTDGSLAGTVSNPLPSGIYEPQRAPQLLGSNANGIQITGTNPSTGPNLYVCDNNANCNLVLSNLEANADYVSTYPLTVVDDKTFFYVHYNGLGDSYWVTDGTTAGTVRLDTTPRGGSSFRYIGKVGIKYLFAARGTSAASSYKIFSSDGTSGAGKWVEVKDTGFNNISGVDFIEPFNSGFVIRFKNENNRVDPDTNPLWFTDGTSVGTTLLGASYGAPDNDNYQLPIKPFTFSGKFYYPAYTAATGVELWVYDGVSAPAIFGDIKAGVTGLFETGVHFSDDTFNAAAVLPSGFIFTAYSAAFGNQFWISDGTIAGTHVISGINPAAATGVKSSIVYNGKAYFAATDNVHGLELWTSDGTVSGTLSFKNLNASIGDANPDNFIKLGSKLFFTANDDLHGNEMWVTDGTVAGTKLTKALGSDMYGIFPGKLTAYNSKLYFVGLKYTSQYKQELYVTDGTSAGTSLVKSIPPNSYNSARVGNLTATSNALYFFASTASSGFEMWKSVGTPGGTNFMDFTAGANDSFDEYSSTLLPMGSNVFFTTGALTYNYPWISDGTIPGSTQLNNTIVGGYRGISPHDGFLAGTNAFFLANDGTTSADELWISDGTPGGTVQVTQVNTLGDPLITFRAALGNEVIFTADDGFSGRELYVSDGTAVGTKQLADLVPGPGSPTNYGEFLVDGSTLYFTIFNTNWELWSTDGTIAGTQKLITLPNVIEYLQSYNGYLYFRYDDGSHGPELWRSNKTQGGTVLYWDLYPGAQGSSPGKVHELGGKIYFAANADKGRQLFMVDPAVGP